MTHTRGPEFETGKEPYGFAHDVRFTIVLLAGTALATLVYIFAWLAFINVWSTGHW